MDRDYYLGKSSEKLKEFDFYSNGKGTINVTQKYYNEQGILSLIQLDFLTFTRSLSPTELLLFLFLFWFEKLN